MMNKAVFLILLTIVATLSVYLIMSEKNKENIPQNGIKIYGGTYLGYYYVDLYVGNPAQKQSAIIDSGSSITAFPCSECTDCGEKYHLNPLFDMKKSKTCETIKCNSSKIDFQCQKCSKNGDCEYNIQYLEGSHLNGIFATDFISLTDPNNANDYANKLLKKRVNIRFGCIENESRLFQRQKANGIFGLGIINHFLNKSTPNFMDQLFNSIEKTDIENSNDTNTRGFSLCYGIKDGWMTVGGYQKNKHLPNETTLVTPYYTDKHQYSIGNKKIKINSENSTGYVDSGTTLVYLPTLIYNKIIKIMNFYCKTKNNCLGLRYGRLCWKFPQVFYPNMKKIDDFYKTFPVIQIKFAKSNKNFIWEPKDYIYYKKSLKSYCLSIRPIRNQIILGGTFMRNHDIFFDRANQEIHMTKANCSE